MTVTNRIDTFIGEHVEFEAHNITESFRKFIPPAFGIIKKVLSPEGLALIKGLDVPTNGHYDMDEFRALEAGRSLLTLMIDISMANRYYPFDRRNVGARLKNISGNHVLLQPHRDLLDGHAVIYNYDIRGEIEYVIGGEKHISGDNELIILNGAADWQDITEFVRENPTPGSHHFGGVTELHSVYGKGITSRNRLLVYAEGQDTLVTQIPERLNEPPSLSEL